jgi:hypothetical protein
MGLIVIIILISAAAWLAYSFATDGPEPRLRFWYCTGLKWSAEARVIRSADSHGGFLGDGEYYLILEADEASIKKWLAERGPWGDWQRGPVPGEIGYHCRFGGPGVGWGGPIGGPETYSGDEELVELLSSDHVWYSARERGDARLRWHNGDLIVIDVRSRRIWLSIWDF